MERFFWSLKQEWANYEPYRNLEDARVRVFRYIETCYNSERLIQRLECQFPNAFEATFQADQAPASAA